MSNYNEVNAVTWKLIKEMGWSHEQVSGLIRFRYRRLCYSDMAWKECLDFLRYVKEIHQETSGLR